MTPQKSDQPFWEAAVGFATISVRRLSIGAKAKPETAMKGSPGQRLHHSHPLPQEQEAWAVPSVATLVACVDVEEESGSLPRVDLLDRNTEHYSPAVISNLKACVSQSRAAICNILARTSHRLCSGSTQIGKVNTILILDETNFISDVKVVGAHQRSPIHGT